MGGAAYRLRRAAFTHAAGLALSDASCAQVPPIPVRAREHPQPIKDFISLVMKNAITIRGVLSLRSFQQSDDRVRSWPRASPGPYSTR